MEEEDVVSVGREGGAESGVEGGVSSNREGASSACANVNLHKK